MTTEEAGMSCGLARQKMKKVDEGREQFRSTEESDYTFITYSDFILRIL